MGKRRHAQDKMYITSREMATDWGSKNEEIERVKGRMKMVKLPFDYCNISMAPFKDPYCTEDGVIFDLLNIVPYLKKQGNKSPITGQPLKQSDLIRLHFHKNESNQYHCPVTFKVFTEHSHIVAIKETGNVYSWDAYRELNKEPQWYHDLLTDEKFDNKKVITIQDPKSPGRDISLYNFDKTKSQPATKKAEDFINVTGS